MRKYFVNNGGQNLGPFAMETILEKIAETELQATDYVYLEDKDEWILICQHPEFLNKFMNRKPPKPAISPKAAAFEEAAKAIPQLAEVPKTEEEEKSRVTKITKPDVDQWYVLKGKDRFGPYSYIDLLKMLQEKTIFEFDHVWYQGLENWKRIAELSVFSAERIQSMLKKSDDASKELKVFFRRHHRRTQYECQFFAHDNKRVWKGLSLEVSEEGAGIVMENSMIQPGHKIFIHFKPGKGSKAFNVTCEIVSKRFAKDLKDTKSPVIYGVKFVNIHKQDREELKKIA